MTDDKSKGKFSTGPPYLGYLYQGVYALYLILRAENYDTKIIIEGLDDIVLSDNELTQIKYHIDEESLSDGSEDLWKTIRVWSEHLINGHISLDDDLILTLITRAKAKPEKGHIAALLRDDAKRDPFEACQRLHEYAMSRDGKLFDEFKKLTKTQRLELVKRIWIIDDSPDISDIQNKIKNIFFQTIDINHRDDVFEQLMGWWKRKIIEHLQDKSPTSISKVEVNQKLLKIADEYKSDNLPSRYKDEKYPIDLEQDNRRFVTHLKKITDLKKDRRVLGRVVK